MRFETNQPIYLFKYSDNEIHQLFLTPFFDFESGGDLWKKLDFVVKFKKGIIIDSVNYNKSLNTFDNTYNQQIIFNNTLSVDDIDRFKISPHSQTKETYLKHLYDGKVFDMQKLNSLTFTCSDFFSNQNIFNEIILSHTLQDSKKIKLNNKYMWIFILIGILIIAYIYYEFAYKNK